MLARPGQHLSPDHDLMNSHTTFTPTPYVVGVTGHRMLDDSAARFAYDKVDSLFKTLKSRLIHTPIIAITGLADGADRLLAKAALKNNIETHVHLPLPADEYRKDFSDASWQEFNHIINNKLVTVSVVEQLHDHKDGEDVVGDARDRQYWVLGQHLICASNLLVSVWDGENTGLTGGTSDVLLDYLDILPRRKQDRLKTIAMPISYLYLDDASQLKGRLAYWLPVARNIDDPTRYTRTRVSRDDCYLSGELGNYELECIATIPTSLLDDLDSLDEYNSKITELIEDNAINRDYGLLNSYDTTKAPIPLDLLDSLDKEFLKADAVAVSNQKHSDSQFALFSMIAATMGILFLLYAKIIASKYLLIGYLILFVVGMVYYKKIQTRHSFTNHLTARALAETLRTQFYLTLLHRSNHKHPGQIMNSCGVSQFRGFNWIKQIVLSKVPMHLQREHKEHHTKYNLEFVIQHWVADQASYFKRKSENLSHRHHKLERIKGYLFVTSFVLASALILFKYEMIAVVLFEDVTLKSIAILLMGLLPFLLGVWEIYQTKMAVKELFWQYRNQSRLFEEALNHIESATTDEQKGIVITELAERALLENYIWIIHRFHREHEPPSAG